MVDPSTTTELEAVNTILSAIGELPTTAGVLAAGSSADVAMASQILGEVNREVQAEGWHFNTDYGVTFTPDGSDFIVISEDEGVGSGPTNIVRVTVPGRDLTIRYNSGTTNHRLYDKAENSYVFSSPLTKAATVVYLFEFYGIPEAAKRYITIRAARLFQDRMVGSVSHHKFTEMDEARALLDLREYEGSTGSPSIFDNQGTFNIIKRGGIL
ncbi:MAG: hypothetical protein GY753_07025 [Gammaproteobacteria bacterium]|nr:hypothetical protein [Gammaproteobacteria bacterium]